MKNKKSRKRIKRSKTIKGYRVEGFGIIQGGHSFSRKDEGDSHF